MKEEIRSFSQKFFRQGMPEISVIIPVYNTKRWLSACLDSLLAQTFQDWEAVCVDDGSTDGSAEILAKYAGEDERIRVFQQENGGPASARNHGMREVRGEYVAFVDADDEVAPRYLEFMIRGLKQYPQAGLAWCEWCRGQERRKMVCPDSVSAVCYPRPLEHCVLHRKPRLQAMIGGRFFRTSAVLDVRFPDGIDYAEDILFTYYALSAMEAGVHIPLPLYVYRKNESSLSQRPFTIHRLDHELACCVQMAVFSQKHSLSSRAQKKLKQTIALRFFRFIVKHIRESDSDGSKGWLASYIHKLHELELQQIFVPAALPLRYRFFYWACKKRFLHD